VKAQLGPGRLLIAVYGVFALSATARASFQLITKFEEAPLAYSLSAISALVYVVATLALAKGERWRTLAYVTVVFELVGVLAVGLMSLILPELFAHPSVWSLFGAGYAFIPLALPILGLIWLRRQDVRN
jgi:hypothetical protein